MLWGRDVNGSNDPRDDVLRFAAFGEYVSPVLHLTTIADPFPRSILGEEPVQQLCDLTEKILGPQESRTPSHARRLATGELAGGTHYERDS